MKLFELFATLALDTGNFDKGIASATKRGKAFGDDLPKRLTAGTIAMGNMISRGVEMVGRAMTSFGSDIVQTSAAVKAEKARFNDTFGDLGDIATNVFDSINKDTGIFATRLKNVGTQAFSQFRGAGVDAKDAMKSMEKHTRIAADAAARYDVSLENADERLRSFLRGNVEAGDAIGLFTSEGQRNTAAIDKYGKKWIDLTEAQKQMLMLDIAESIYEQSGAIGQAERESGAWANTVGNLKEAWRQAKALIGSEIEEKLTPILGKIADYLADESTQKALSDFGGVLGTIAGYAFDGVTGLFGWIMENKDSFVAAGENITAFFSDLWGWISSFDSGEGTVGKVITILTGLWAVLSPGSFKLSVVIAGLLLIASNWETIKTAVTAAWEAVETFFSETLPDWWEEKVTGPIVEKWNSVKASIDRAITAVRNFLGMNNGISVHTSSSGSTHGGSVGRRWTTTYTTPAGPPLPEGWSPKSSGLPYVPSDNYPILAHRGETLLPRFEAEAYRNGRASGGVLSIDYDRLAMAMSGLTVQMDGRTVGHLVAPAVSREIYKQAEGGRYR